MSALPSPLKPWAGQLAILQRELALAVAPWVQRLSLGIGPLSDAESRPTGAPDGYDGVARKGSYERLLTSEWLYADEAPDEFLRRAAQGEHLFSRLAVREPHHARRCLVLFDSGPSQLGTPRIAHLAAFIAFAARCEAAHAKLSWGVVQSSPSFVKTGFDKEQAQALLKSRTTREPTEVDLAAWLTAFGAAVDDVWLVGSPETCALPSAARYQLVEASELQAQARRVEVAVRRSGRTRQLVQLELPPPETCTALLRAPFAIDLPKVPPRSSGAVRPSKGLVFSASGNRLFTKGTGGELLCIVLPNGVASTTKQVPFSPPATDRVLAGGWRKGMTALTVRHDGAGRALRLVSWSLSKRGERKEEPETFELPSAMSADALATDGLSSITTLTFGRRRKTIVSLLGRAFVLSEERVNELPHRVLAHTQRSERAIFVTLDAEGRRHVRTLFSNNTETLTLLEGVGECVAFIAGGQRWPLPIVAVGDTATSTRWVVIDHGRPSLGLDVPDGGTVVGVTMPSRWPAGLLVRSADRRRLLHVSAAGTQTIVESEHPIIEVATDFELPRFAWLDGAGAVGLFDASSPQHVFLGLPDGQGRRLVHFSEVRR